MTEKWIEELKVGDKFVTEQYLGSGITPHLVTQITKKQIVSNKLRFWKERGRMVGSSGWHTTFMKPFNAEAKLTVMQQNVHYLARKINYSKIPLEPLQKIYKELVLVYNKEEK